MYWLGLYKRERFCLHPNFTTYPLDQPTLSAYRTHCTVCLSQYKGIRRDLEDQVQKLLALNEYKVAHNGLAGHYGLRLGTIRKVYLPSNHIIALFCFPGVTGGGIFGEALPYLGVPGFLIWFLFTSSSPILRRSSAQSENSAP